MRIQIRNLRTDIRAVRTDIRTVRTNCWEGQTERCLYDLQRKKIDKMAFISLVWNELIVVITTLFEVDSDDVASAGFYLIFNIKFIVLLSKPFQKRGFMMTIKCNEKFCSLIRNKPGHVDGISFILPFVETSSPANGIAACIRLFLYIVLLLGG
ncbi:MAG: hypothetical protein HUK10_04660 [Bacteroides heparinolyticus]|nr:hypothetical protein [Bacteroides heparinolyticus]